MAWNLFLEIGALREGLPKKNLHARRELDNSGKNEYYNCINLKKMSSSISWDIEA